MSMQRALLEAGLITQKQYQAGLEQQSKKEVADRKKMVKQVAAAEDSFPSIRSVMDFIKKELRANPSPGNLGRLIKKAHETADRLKLKEKKRKKMHAFLAKVGEGLASRPNKDEKLAFLDEVFLKTDPAEVSE